MEMAFEDPITFEVMSEAVIAPCGHSFSSESIRQWLGNHTSCPTCKLDLSVGDLKPNYGLRQAIEEFRKLQVGSSSPTGADININNSTNNLNNNSTNNLLANSSSPNARPPALIKELNPNHIELAGGVLEDAFRRDPWIQYFYSNSNYDVESMKWFYSRMVTYGLQHGRVWAAYDRNNLKGVALWQPPHDVGVSAWNMLKAGMAKAPFKMGLKASFKAVSVLEYTEKVRTEYMTTPHWSVYTIGVIASSQDRGIGTAMMQPVLSMADADNLPIYLDTASERTVGFFRKIGFEVVKEIPSPPHGPKFWAMVRPASNITANYD